jgi:hypothetical protein
VESNVTQRSDCAKAAVGKSSAANQENWLYYTTAQKKMRQLLSNDRNYESGAEPQI